jgi:hypothetical protein
LLIYFIFIDIDGDPNLKPGRHHLEFPMLNYAFSEVLWLFEGGRGHHIKVCFFYLVNLLFIILSSSLKHSELVQICHQFILKLQVHFAKPFLQEDDLN